MDSRKTKGRLTRRSFLRSLAAGISVPYFQRFPGLRNSTVLNDVFWVRGIPDQPFYDPSQPNCHIGLDSLLSLMAENGLMFYRSQGGGAFAGPSGLIAPEDIVLIKVNAQWKYRGCTNSDLIRGLIQRILDHPDGFNGEVVIVENGQGRGSLSCATPAAYGRDASVHANANDESHHFLYLVENVFKDRRVSATLLDPVRMTFIDAHDHATDGFRIFESVSYPCFTTAGGSRVELKEGIWKAGAHHRNLKLINVPVLKHHDTGGSEITASLKHFYGLVSMADGQSGPRHYGKLGKTCGTMIASVATPVLNIIDAIWVSYSSLKGYPAETTFRTNQLLASQDPVAADYLAAKYILYPVDGNFRHHPDFSGIDNWLLEARDTINQLGGLADEEKGVLVGRVTKEESEMRVRGCNAGDFLSDARLAVSRSELHFFGPALGPRPLQRYLDIDVSGGRPLTWTIETDVPWLSSFPSSGSGNKTVTVIAYPDGLESGRHAGRITIHCPRAVNAPLAVSVSLNVPDRPRRAGRL
jgi:hypothetical protein